MEWNEAKNWGDEDDEHERNENNKPEKNQRNERANRKTTEHKKPTIITIWESNRVALSLVLLYHISHCSFLIICFP